MTPFDKFYYSCSNSTVLWRRLCVYCVQFARHRYIEFAENRDFFISIVYSCRYHFYIENDPEWNFTS